MVSSPEINAWNKCALDDLWIFDKLIVAKKAGHLCGPRGTPVPISGNYFVRPVINIEGMGERARVEYLEEETLHLHPGEFWSEIFTGDHVSVDYVKYEPVLSVIGTKHATRPYSRFAYWEKTEKTHPLPQFLGLMPLRYGKINCEFIDGKLIEIHLRGNSDFSHNNSSMIPVWKDEHPDGFDIDFHYTHLIRDGYRFISDGGEELERLGIWVR
jgi:hypothetical protein